MFVNTVSMKKILRLYRNWRYRRLYRKLFWHYANKTNDCDTAIYEANKAFFYLTNHDAFEFMVAQGIY